MHELSIASALLALCEDRLAQRGGGTLTAVRIAVGELSAVEPALLRQAWSGVLSGTRHDGCALDIAWHAVQQLCAACGDVAERQPGTWLRLCPRCDQPLRLSGGDQLDLLSFTTTTPTRATEEAMP